MTNGKGREGQQDRHVELAMRALRLLEKDEKASLAKKMKLAYPNARLETALGEEFRIRGIEDPGLSDPTLKSCLTFLQVEWYRGLVEAAGHRWDEQPGSLNVVGLRGWHRIEGPHPNAFEGTGNAYNDTIAFIAIEEDKNRKQLKAVFLEYDASTDAGKNTPGTVRLVPGQYEFEWGRHKGIPGAGVAKGGAALPVLRLDERGAFSEKDAAAGISIHWRGPVETKVVGHWSDGSQVVDIEPKKFSELISPLFKNAAHCTYTLLDKTA